MLSNSVVETRIYELFSYATGIHKMLYSTYSKFQHIFHMLMCGDCAFNPLLSSDTNLVHVVFLGEPISVLDGVPVAIKDEIDCLPYPTTGSARCY